MQYRSTRRREVRATTEAVKRYTVLKKTLIKTSQPIAPYDKPRCRGDCEFDERPCPFVSCKHHLYLDVNPKTGAIKLNFPDLEPWQLEWTCALDVADLGGIYLEQVGETMNLTRESIRLYELRCIRKIRESRRSNALRVYYK